MADSGSRGGVEEKCHRRTGPSPWSFSGFWYDISTWSRELGGLISETPVCVDRCSSPITT